ncbi:unnamed protein product [Closterium sp. NIES-54]
MHSPGAVATAIAAAAEARQHAASAAAEGRKNAASAAADSAGSAVTNASNASATAAGGASASDYASAAAATTAAGGTNESEYGEGTIESAEEITTLNRDITYSALQILHLNYGLHHKTSLLSLNCTGKPCPDFPGSCGERFPNISACWNTGLVDEGYVKPPTPINCPKINNVNDLKPEGRDTSCSHYTDFHWHDQAAYQVFRLSDVYVNDDGNVFNATTLFNKGDCNGHLNFSVKAGKTQVHHVDKAVSLVYRQADAFYHGFIEWQPAFYILHSVLAAHPDIPLLARPSQWRFYHRTIQHVVGVSTSSFRRLAIPEGALFHVKELYLPLYQSCGNPSPAIWHTLRYNHILLPEGLPYFHEDRWQLRNVPRGDGPGNFPGSSDDGLGNASVGFRDRGYWSKVFPLPRDWIVVVVQRLGAKGRTMKQFGQLLGAVQKLFGMGRVHIFNGTQSVYETRDLFSKARLLVAGHGAGMSHMIFMPPNGTVLEIRPDNYDNACFHHLSHACDLNYYLVFGKGARLKPLTFDKQKVIRILRQIKEDFGNPRYW